MSDLAVALSRIVGDKSRIVWVRGYYRGLDGLRVLVDFDGGRVPAHPVTSYRPAVNEPVWVCIVDDVAYMVGPTRPLPADGVVVAVASGIATLDTDIGSVRATFPLGATLTAGQEVKLLWGGELPHVLSVKSTTPSPGQPAPGGGGSVQEYTKTFTAIDAGSFYSSWWQAQVWSAANNLAAWFYGSKIPDTIPGGAEILSVEIYLSVVQIFGDPMNLGLHTHQYKPGGAPGIFSTSSVAPSAGWVGLPIYLGNALRNGGGSYGVGVAHGGFHKFKSLGEDGMSGALRIRYRA